MKPWHQWVIGRGPRLTPGQLATHAALIGQTGSGKSRTLESWAMQQIEAGHGVAVIDPHGDIYQNLVFRLSLLAQRQSGLAQRIVLINPSDSRWTVGFNPLEPIRGIALERLAWFLTDVILKIWKVDPTTLARTSRLLTYSFLCLAERGLTLVDLPRFLCDTTWRSDLVARTCYREVRDYFRYEFPTTPSAAHQWVTPVLNKIGPLIYDPDVRLMLATRSTINFRRILDEKLVVLVNLSKGILGEGNSALLGAFIVAHLQQAALSRADSHKREPFFLYLDEFQNYTTDNIKDILTESRKYGLSLILAHQYLEQIPVDLRGAVLNTVGTLVCFRLGYQDGSTLARELFPPGSVRQTRSELSFVRIGQNAVPVFSDRGEELGHEHQVALLTQLKERQFWAKRRGPYAPIKCRALDMPAPDPSPELFAARKELIETSGKQFGKMKSKVREELRHGNHDPNSATTYYEKT